MLFPKCLLVLACIAGTWTPSRQGIDLALNGRRKTPTECCYLIPTEPCEDMVQPACPQVEEAQG